jgi:hypothetical protein
VDIAKAFDTTHFDGFLDPLRAMGFDEHTIQLFRALQDDFECEARTVYGRTKPIRIKVGTKQGDRLSPVKFVLFVDMFVRWCRHRGLGYRFTVRRGRAGSLTPPTDDITILIGPLGYYDDITFLTHDNTTMSTILSAFDAFLATYGMSMAPLKCLYSAVIPPGSRSPPPPLSIYDASRGEPLTIPFVSPDTHIRFLSIKLRLLSSSAQPPASPEEWAPQFEAARTTLAAAADRITHAPSRSTMPREASP